MDLMIQSFTRRVGPSYSSVKQLPSQPVSVVEEEDEEVLDNEQEVQLDKKQVSIIQRHQDIINGTLSDSSSKNTSMADDLRLVCFSGHGDGHAIGTGSDGEGARNTPNGNCSFEQHQQFNSTCVLCNECPLGDEDEGEEVTPSGHFQMLHPDGDEACPYCDQEDHLIQQQQQQQQQRQHQEYFCASTFYFDVDEEDDEDETENEDEEGENEKDERPAASAASPGQGAKCKLKSSANWLLRFFGSK